LEFQGENNSKFVAMASTDYLPVLPLLHIVVTVK